MIKVLEVQTLVPPGRWEAATEIELWRGISQFMNRLAITMDRLINLERLYKPVCGTSMRAAKYCTIFFYIWR